MTAIEVQGLRRIYRARLGVFRRQVKEVVAVDGIDFQVERGRLAVGLACALAGFAVFSWFEFQARRRGTLEAF